MLAAPRRWDVRRLRDIAELRVSNVDKHEKDGEVPVRLCNYVDVYKNDRITERIPFMRASAAEDEVERFRLRRGDVLITKDSETWTDIGVPALVEYEADDLVSGYHLALLRPRRERIGGAFLLRALQSPDVAHQLHVAATGVTRYGLSHADIKSILVPVPSLEDQGAIVRFLDHADRRIRRAIRAKQKLIVLLNEQKQAVIHRAVTRGLDPNVRLKPSDVDWLGDVPEHWEVAKLKQCLRAPLAYGVLKPDKYSGANAVPIIRILDVVEGAVLTEKLERISPDQDAEFARTRVVAGDVVISVVGTIGRSAVISRTLGQANLSRALCRVQLGDRVLPEFLQIYLQSRAFLDQAESVPAGTAQRVLNLGDLRQFDIALPPVPEQQAILHLIDNAVAELAAAVAGARSTVALLREYRTRLIADVVTGKLDIRTASPELVEA